ncbi:Hypothetical protein CINCED_3A019524 [Cinara cedri]|uniref:Uncharacterized protein n=1 Tax=Cinara cedri TaxID=506608 RepID=A0A5E4N928_9HEMI|nr:Hypothetical protein CINCED_3A019524 [Cinara cedri]
MSKIMEFKDAVPEQEVFNVRLVKCSPPIIIKDGSKIEDNSKGVNVTETLENNYQSLKDRNNLLKKETTEAQRRYAIIKHNLIEEFNALKISNQHEIEFYTINTEALQAQANMILNTKK